MNKLADPANSYSASTFENDTRTKFFKIAQHESSNISGSGGQGSDDKHCNALNGGPDHISFAEFESYYREQFQRKDEPVVVMRSIPSDQLIIASLHLLCCVDMHRT